MSAQAKRRLGHVALAAALLPAGLASAAQAQTVTGPSFQVALTLSPAAAARLANPRETVIVDVEFYGVPASEKLRMADQGRLDLATEPGHPLYPTPSLTRHDFRHEAALV